MESYNDQFYEFMQRAFACADSIHWPRDSPAARNERVLDHCRSTLGPMPPGMEYVVKEMIENPHLILADVRACRDHVLKKGHCFKDPDLPKDSGRAAELRREGNRLYLQKDFESALEKYNESICCAPNDSEDLGLGYANRSAIFYEQGEYELTLANIALAKDHNYPGQLMQKLIARENNCRDQILENTATKNSRKCPTLTLNSEANPRIPFLAKGISARQLPIFGNSLVAEQDFKAGDVILHEKPLKTCLSFTRKFTHCNHCLSGNLFHLIPCSKCTSAMFCNEECRQEGFKMHRFECGATAKLVRLNDLLLGPRMFFHGLTLFDDDVDKLMAFCQENRETEKSFFDLDYSNRDPLEEFKVFLGIKIRTIPKFEAMLNMNAAMFYSSFMEIPLVRSLFTTETHKDFMLECFAEFMFLKIGFGIYHNSNVYNNGQIYPIASICNHSCDPNTLALVYGGQLKLVVTRPIRRGEQILVSYGSHHTQPSSMRENRLSEAGFDCACDVCDKHKRPMWLAKYERKNCIPMAHWETAFRVVTDDSCTDADKVNALQQFVQRYAKFHPQEQFSTLLQVYCAVLTNCNKLGMDAAMRKKIAG